MAGNVLYETSAPQGVRFACVSVQAPAFPRNDPAPMTYRAWLRQRLDRDMAGDFSFVRVQFMRRGLKGCGVVVDAKLGDGGQDWFHVQEAYTGVVGWLPSSKVRLCSGDGRCACEDMAAAPGSARACTGAPGALTVPPGNTGTTVGGRA